MQIARKIEDFGQKIEGARKHRTALAWAEKLLDEKDPSTENGGLSALWPAPNYEKMIEEGSEAWLIAFAHALRDLAKAAPKSIRGGRFRYRAWRKRTLPLRELAILAVKGELDIGDPEIIEGNETTARAKVDISTRTMIYHDHGHKTKISNLEFEHVKNREGQTKGWIAYERKGSMCLVRVETTTQDELVKEVANRAGGNTQTQDRTNSNVRKHYRVRMWNDTKEIWITRRGTGKHARLIKCTNANEGHRIIANEPERCEEAWKGWKNIPPMRPKEARPRTGPRPELGRIGPEEFTRAVGLRGVQFGNWLGYARREDEIVKAYLALHDLSDAIKWTIGQISLEGELALALGARGNGGRNAGAAHYEPDRKVINLTRNNGAGSLAHEWWHALDHHIARKARLSGYATEQRLEGDEPTLKAAKALARAISETGIPTRSAKLDARRAKPYWATMREMTARAFERYVCERALTAGVENDYLVRFTSFGQWTQEATKSLEMSETYPYSTPEESQHLAPYYEMVLKNAG